MFDRFFSFGCSLTHHIWPTWADIIARDLNIPFENWGRTGAGNIAIQSKIVECDFVNKFTKNDLIMIVWSTWQREDRYLDSVWKCYGTVFNNPMYDKNFIKKYWSEENDYIKNIVAMHTTQRAYSDQIKFEGTFYLPDVSKGDYELSKNETPSMLKIKNVFYENFKKPILLQYNIGQQRSYNNKCIDYHPDILQHLKFVEDHMYPKINITLKQETINFCHDYYNEVVKTIDVEDNFEQVYDKIININDKFNIDLRSCHGI